ncbi:MAG: hypothetical protein Q4D16_13480 [Eubacteriales bacterium]|nr:hypothetical protein [Eubacteriales bacterium]
MYTSDHIAVGIATKELKNSSTGVYVRNYATKISERLFVLIGGKINGGGYFSDGEDFTDGDPGFTDGGDPGFTDGN